MLSEFLTPEYTDYEEVQTALEAFGRCAQFLSDHARKLTNDNNFVMIDGYLTSVGFEAADSLPGKTADVKKDGILKRAWEAIKAFFARIKGWFSKIIDRTRLMITGMQRDEARRIAPKQIKAVRSFCLANRKISDQVLETEIGQQISATAVNRLGNNKGLETIVEKGFKTIAPDLAMLSKELESLKKLVVKADEKGAVNVSDISLKIDEGAVTELNEVHGKIEPIGELLNEKPTKPISYLNYLMTSGDILDTSSITQFKLKEYEKTIDAIGNLFDKFDKRLGYNYETTANKFFERLELKTTISTYQLIIKLSNLVFKDHMTVLSFFRLRESQWAFSHTTLLGVMEAMKRFAEPAEKASIEKNIKALKDEWKGVNDIVIGTPSNEDYDDGLIGKIKSFIQWLGELVKRCVERIRKMLGYKRNEKDAEFADKWHVVGRLIEETLSNDLHIDKLYGINFSTDEHVNDMAFAPNGAKASLLIKELDDHLVLSKKITKLISEMNEGNAGYKDEEIRSAIEKEKDGQRIKPNSRSENFYRLENQKQFFQKGVFGNMLHDALHKKNYDRQLEDSLKAFKEALDSKTGSFRSPISARILTGRHIRAMLERTFYLQHVLMAGVLGNETIRKAIVERTPVVIQKLIEDPSSTRSKREKLDKAESYL